MVRGDDDDDKYNNLRKEREKESKVVIDKNDDRRNYIDKLKSRRPKSRTSLKKWDTGEPHQVKKVGYRGGHTKVKKQETELTLGLGDVHHSSEDNVDIASTPDSEVATFKRNYFSGWSLQPGRSGAQTK